MKQVLLLLVVVVAVSATKELKLKEISNLIHDELARVKRSSSKNAASDALAAVAELKSVGLSRNKRDIAMTASHLASVHAVAAGLIRARRAAVGKTDKVQQLGKDIAEELSRFKRSADIEAVAKHLDMSHHLSKRSLRATDKLHLISKAMKRAKRHLSKSQI